jgi:hypothetical protein
MKYIILALVLGLNLNLKAQKVGYEIRTNQRSYLTVSQKVFRSSLELRHRFDLKENRVTYRHNLSINDSSRWVLSIPLHYKIESSVPTLEPRLIYKFNKFKLWVQHEFNHKESMNTAIAVDTQVNRLYYRIGWDTSNTVRFRISVSF